MQGIKLDFKRWVSEQLRTEDFSIQALRNDASFRSYYRVKQRKFSYVVMVAPPEKEKTDHFVNIAQAWRLEALPVPQIFAWNQEKGYVLLSDFGDTLLLDVLNINNVEKYYGQAMDLLIHLQNRAPLNLPLFNEAYIRSELNLFREWFCEKWLGVDKKAQTVLEPVNQMLIANCLEQPQIVIHRDYHSRNLMVLADPRQLGIIDFQDAMIGPLTYDLASILKDCYVQWPLGNIHAWAKEYYQKIVPHYAALPEWDCFVKWFDWTGLQRHLKVLGIFSRLNLRDNKPHYLQDIPRIRQYVLDVTERYEAFANFHHWFQGISLPGIKIGA